MSFPRRRESKRNIHFKNVIIDWIPFFKGMTMLINKFSYFLILSVVSEKFYKSQTKVLLQLDTELVQGNFCIMLRR